MIDLSFIKRSPASWCLSERDYEKCYEEWYESLSREEKRELKAENRSLSELPCEHPLKKRFSELVKYKVEKKRSFIRSSFIHVLQIILLIIVGMSFLIVLRDAHLMEKYIAETEEIVVSLQHENEQGTLDPEVHKQTIERLNELVLKHSGIEEYHSTQIIATIILSLLLLFWYFVQLFYQQKEVTKNFQSIYSSAQSFILLFNPFTGRIIDANPALIRVLGYTLHALRQLRISDIEQAHTDEEGAPEVTEEKKERWFTKKNGEQVQVEAEICDVKYNGQKARLMIMTDITERNKMEKQIADKMLQLESAMVNLLETKEELNKTNIDLSSALQKAVDISSYLLQKSPLVPTFLFSPIFHLSHDREGGDSLIFTSFRERYVGLFLQDVCGHDINAILDNIYANLLVESYKIDQAKKSVRIPEMVLYYLNRDLNDYYRKIGDEKEENAGKFTTAVYGLLDYEKGEVCISLAGHEPVICISPNGSYRFISAGGLPLGLFPPEEDEDYQSETSVLENGEKLFFYTDGVMEQFNEQGETFKGYFIDTLLPQMAELNAHECYHLLKDAFFAFVGDGNLPDDDITFLVIERKPERAYHHLCFSPGKELSEAAISKLVDVNQMITREELEKLHQQKPPQREKCDDSVLIIEAVEEAYKPLLDSVQQEFEISDDLLFRIRYCLEEAIANAIEHGNLASPHYVVHLRWTFYAGILECCVEDEGEGLREGDIPQRIGTEEALWIPYGRGRRIIEQYSDYVYNNSKGNALYIIFKLPREEKRIVQEGEKELGKTTESDLVKW